jgi:hypothetical protein
MSEHEIANQLAEMQAQIEELLETVELLKRDLERLVVLPETDSTETTARDW